METSPIALVGLSWLFGLLTGFLFKIIIDGPDEMDD